MARQVVTLFSGQNREATESALSALKSLPGVRVKVVEWPPESRIRVLLPFVEMETGVRYYGVTSINDLVRRRMAS